MGRRAFALGRSRKQALFLVVIPPAIFRDSFVISLWAVLGVLVLPLFNGEILVGPVIDVAASRSLATIALVIPSILALLAVKPVRTQYGVCDTMLDLVFNAIGAVIVGIFGTARLSGVAEGIRQRLE